METILLVDDEPAVLRSQKSLLELHGHRSIVGVTSAEPARAQFEAHEIAMAIVDLTLTRESGMELIKWIKEHYPDTVVLVVTGASDLAIAVECMRNGAYDFLVKGNDSGRLPSAVRNALAYRRTNLENDRLRTALVSNTLRNPAAFEGFVTASPAIRHLFVYLEAVATTPDPILITGETGVGKEVVARAVHTASGRSGPFVAVNLGGLDDQTVSDTLFGHTRGAFTGAQGSRDGVVRTAADGTLFLDEFAEISPETQVKLLRLIDSGELRPLGSDRVFRSQARLVFATNRDLHRRIEDNSFRRDLYFRISGHGIEIPPLRDRPEDIEPILLHLMAAESQRLRRDPLPITAGVLRQIKAMPLLGNARELQQLVVTALVRGEWQVHAPAERPQQSLTNTWPEDSDTPIAFGRSLPTPAAAIEALLREADRRYPNNRGRAAAAVGLTPQAFANRWKRMSESAVSREHHR